MGWDRWDRQNQPTGNTRNVCVIVSTPCACACVQPLPPCPVRVVADRRLFPTCLSPFHSTLLGPPATNRAKRTDEQTNKHDIGYNNPTNPIPLLRSTLPPPRVGCTFAARRPPLSGVDSTRLDSSAELTRHCETRLDSQRGHAEQQGTHH